MVEVRTFRAYAPSGEDGGFSILRVKPTLILDNLTGDVTLDGSECAQDEKNSGEGGGCTHARPSARELLTKYAQSK